jgi:putative transposase
MSQVTPPITRSRRKVRRRDPMKTVKTLPLPDGRTGVQVTMPFDPSMLIDDAFEAIATEIGLTVMEGLLEDEAERLAGAKHAKLDGYPVRRHGYEEGSVVFAGKRLAILRPRLRGEAGEVLLHRYGLFRAGRKMKRSVRTKILAKVSTRRYESVVDEVAEGFGIRKSSVSRHWRASSAEELAGLLARPLGELDLVAVLIDGVHFQGAVLVVALGIASDGRKHLLGLWEGSTENTATVTTLLASLRDRGLRTDSHRLFILDGAKALSAGVRAVFGDHAVIQRCWVHKKRNVLEQLPKTHHWRIGTQLSAAWGMNDLAEARAALDRLLSELDRLSAPAAASLREGLDETLTLHRLGIPPTIRSRLATTNAIENLFSVLRDQVRRVRNWKSGPDMRQRWAAAILLDAEQRFHRLKNHSLLTEVANRLVKTDQQACSA